MMKNEPKRRIKQNVWGNWKGYLGREYFYDFGTNEQDAQEWVKSGELPKYDASVYVNPMVRK